MPHRSPTTCCRLGPGEKARKTTRSLSECTLDYVSSEIDDDETNRQHALGCSLYGTVDKIRKPWERSTMLGCNDSQRRSLHMHEGWLALVFPRRRAYTGHVIHARQARELRDLRASRISLISHISCIHTSRLSIYDSWSSIFYRSLVSNLSNYLRVIIYNVT
jgi:hypothetical protein